VKGRKRAAQPPAQNIFALHALPADDVYALTGYILDLDDVVPCDFVTDRDNLPKVKMPNRENFSWTDPHRTTG
jgi:hypothetical protein